MHRTDPSQLAEANSSAMSDGVLIALFKVLKSDKFGEELYNLRSAGFDLPGGSKFDNMVTDIQRNRNVRKAVESLAAVIAKEIENRYATGLGA